VIATASVVVPCTGGEEMLEGCLASLEPQRADAEVIAVGAWDAAARERLSRLFPWTTFVDAEGGTSVFVRRSQGLARAKGSRVLLLEDHCRPSSGWLQALATTAHATAVGPVASGSSRSLATFALYLVEYSALMPPLAEGPIAARLAVNASYRREALLSVAEVWREAFHDNEVHDALRAAGHAPHAVAEALVESRLELPLGAACAHLFSGGRRFGGYCDRRALRVLAAPLLPFVLLGRILARVARRQPGSLPRALLSAPVILVLVTAWSLGEGLGALAPRRR
jgi:hypothetical protein